MSDTPKTVEDMVRSFWSGIYIDAERWREWRSIYNEDDATSKAFVENIDKRIAERIARHAKGRDTP